MQDLISHYTDEITGLVFKVSKNFYGTELKSFTFEYSGGLFYTAKQPNRELAIEEFLDVFHGRVWKGIASDNYFTEETNCYLMYDGRQYKIGKSIDPEKRLRTMRTGNPSIKLLFYSPNIPEKFLHQMFNPLNTQLEWFRLTQSDVRTIEILMDVKSKETMKCLMRMGHKRVANSKPTRQECYDKIYSKTKLQYGRYAGRKLGSFKTGEEFQYMDWLHGKMIENKQTGKELFKALDWTLKNAKIIT